MRHNWVGLFVGIATLVLVFGLGVMSAPKASPEKMSVEESSRLACHQEVSYGGGQVTIRPYTDTELEGRLHAAQMSLRTAEAKGVWTDLGQRWAMLASAQMLEVQVCR